MSDAATDAIDATHQTAGWGVRQAAEFVSCVGDGEVAEVKLHPTLTVRCRWSAPAHWSSDTIAAWPPCPIEMGRPMQVVDLVIGDATFRLAVDTEENQVLEEFTAAMRDNPVWSKLPGTSGDDDILSG